MWRRLFWSLLFKTFNLKLNKKMRIHLNNPLNGNGLVQSTKVRHFISYKHFDTLWRCQACTRFYASLKAPTCPKILKITMSWDQQT